MDQVDSAGSRFGVDGYVVVPGLLAQPPRAFLHDYALKAAQSGKLSTDTAQMPGTPSRYGDPLMEALLEILRPRMESETGLTLAPTYSYFRVYRRGDVLHRHTDRPACEVSATVSLGSNGLWPIWLQAAGAAREVRLNPGDALIYRGIELAHWRDAFEGHDAAQVFLHYVDRRGKNTDWIFDKRTRLATSPPALQIVRRLVESG
jgi:hypothetical protein